MVTKFEPQLEKLMTFFAGDKYQRELIDGKKFFFSKLGIGADDPDGFEPRMNLFFDWFLFTRQLNFNGELPAHFVITAPDIEIEKSERKIYEALARTEHSLFEVLRVRTEDVLLYDVFSQEKKLVKDSGFSFGLEAGQLFDGRLVPIDDTYWFCKGFCFHPPEVKTFIEKEVLQLPSLDLDAQEDLMLKLMQMKFKVDKYRHLKLSDVYSNTTRVKF